MTKANQTTPLARKRATVSWSSVDDQLPAPVVMDSIGVPKPSHEDHPRRASWASGEHGVVVVIVESGDKELVYAPGQAPHLLVAPAPDGGYGWIIVFAVFMIHVIVDGVSYSFGVIFPELLLRFGGTKSETSWIMSILIGAASACAPIPGYLTSHFGRRAVAFLGGIMAFAGALFSCFATEIWQLALSFGLLTGLGFGFMYLPAIVSVTSWFSKWRGLAVGIAVCGAGVGTMAMAPLAEFLLKEFSLTGCLMIYAGIILNACVFSALLRPTPLEIQAEKTRKKLQLLHQQNSQLELTNLPKTKINHHERATTFYNRVITFFKARTDVELLKEWRFWLFSFSAFLGGVCSYVPYTYLPHRAESEIISIDNAAAAQLITFMGFGNLFGRLGSSAISDRPWLNRIVLYGAWWLVAGLATALSVFCVNYSMFVVYSVVYGFSHGFIIAIQPVVLTDIFGLEKLTSAFSLLLFIEGGAVFAGPPIAGAITDYEDSSYTVAFIVIGTLMALAGCTILLIPCINYVYERSNQRKE